MIGYNYMALNDQEIIEYCRSANLIDPFVDHKVEKGGDILMSYGLDPQGYTFRVDSGYDLEPLNGVKVTSLESFRLPINYFGLFRGKSSYTRNGLLFSCATVDAGYKGHLEFYVFNASRQPIRIVRQQGIAQINFLPINTPNEAYKGVYAA